MSEGYRLYNLVAYSWSTGNRDWGKADVLFTFSMDYSWSNNAGGEMLNDKITQLNLC